MSEEILQIPEFDPFDDSPETIRDTYATITAYLGLSRMSEVRLTLDYRNVRKAIYFESSADGYLDMLTMDECEFYKIYAEADVWLSSKIKVFGSIQFAFSETSDDFTHFTYLPKTQYFLGISIKIFKNWTITAEVEDKGKVYTNAHEETELDSFTLVNLELSYKIEEYLTFFVKATNLTDEDYFEYEGWQGFDQMFLFGLEVTF